jgi:hypothetical protein
MPAPPFLTHMFGRPLSRAAACTTYCRRNRNVGSALDVRRNRTMALPRRPWADLVPSSVHESNHSPAVLGERRLQADFGATPGTVDQSCAFMRPGEAKTAISDRKMSTLSRRAILGSGVAGGLLTAAIAAEGTFGNPDQPAEGSVNATNPKALTDPGPQDPNLAGNEPAFLNPPATDVNGSPSFGLRSTLLPSVSRMVVGRGKLPRMTLASRRRFQA